MDLINIKSTGGAPHAGKEHVGFEVETLELLARLKPHARAIGIGTLLLVAAIIGTILFLTNRRASLADGYAALQTASSTDALKALAAKYKDTAVGEQAAFALAKHLFDTGVFDEAASRFQLFCIAYPASTLSGRAKLGLAYAMESAGKQGPAEKKFADFAKEIGTPELSAEGYVGAARCAQAQNKPAEAEKWYKAAVSAGSSGIYKYQALEALKGLAQPVTKPVAAPAPPAAATVPTPAPAAPAAKP